MVKQFFPGRDYPDREVWLKIRTTPANLWRHRGLTIYSSRKGGKPMVLGINFQKHQEEQLLGGRGRRFPKKPPIKGGTIVGIVGARHAYYAQRYESQVKS